ncbi:MAG: hypothetical protein HY308_01530 [Gammaproteobacteria bacterium]|nr:hypothetical protein [Gammaproteobacteria bacterium]
MRAVFVLLAMFGLANYVSAASLEEDGTRYIQIFNGDKAQHSEVANTFAYMGLSDTRLFDIIEQRLLADYGEGAAADRDDYNRLARYIRALGFSGQAKYEKTIGKFVGVTAYERHAQSALADIPVYNKWNPIIADRRSFDPKLSDDANRVMNMLRADDLLLKRLGAKRVYHGHINDEVVSDLLAAQLKANYARTDLKEPEFSGTMAHMIKALGASKNPKYRALIEEVAASSKNGAIQRHAATALGKGRLGDSADSSGEK